MVISVSLVLFLLGLLGVFMITSQKLSEYVKENIAISIFINEDAPSAEVMHYKKSLDAKEFVRKTTFIDKDKAAEVLTEDLGEDFVGFLGYNPLHASIDVYLNADYLEADSVAQIEQELALSEIVKEVYYQKDLIALVNQNVQKISFFIIGFAVLLALISMVLINNNVRLSIYAKRMIIRTMQLVGATPGFITRPFLMNGLLQGLLGGVFACLLLSILLYYFAVNYTDLFVAKDLDMVVLLYVALILFGMFLCAITSFFAVRNYIKINPDKLY